MKEVLNRLFEYQTLSKAEARDLLVKIAQGNYNSEQIAAFITVYLMRSVTVDELGGFRDALLELCNSMDFSEFDPIDLCGTGGDGKNTFNISTLTSFVLAGAGYKVAKHGNYGVSSACGSSNVIEYLGYNFTSVEAALKMQLDKCNICMMHAPLFHPAMKNVAPVRKALGIKTFFNMLGPMVNPAFPKIQYVGVFNLELARLYHYIFQKEKEKRYQIVYSLDGYDEISLTGAFRCINRKGEHLLTPADISMQILEPETIKGGTSIPEAASVFIQILEGKGSREQNDVVIANSILAIQCIEEKMSVEDAGAKARESLESGKALDCFKRLISLS